MFVFGGENGDLPMPEPDLNRNFITFEGIDFSGKSTQAVRLYNRLAKKCSCLLLRDPGTTRISERIRSILLDKNHTAMSHWTELLLYEAARAQMVEETIVPALKEGRIVICDRFYDSTTAYQGYGRGLDLQFVEYANQIGSCRLTPAKTFLFDVEPGVVRVRKEKSNREEDRLEAEGIEFLKRVRAGYQSIAKGNPDRFYLLDGGRSVSELEDNIWNIISNYLF
jgi:dTMP kinase